MTLDPDPFDVGPERPPWCEPDTQPSWDSLASDGSSILSWVREIGTSVWIAADDTIQIGKWVRSPASIGFCEPPRGGLDVAGARRLAAELLDAADGGRGKNPSKITGVYGIAEADILDPPA